MFGYKEGMENLSSDNDKKQYDTSYFPVENFWKALLELTRHNTM